MSAAACNQVVWSDAAIKENKDRCRALIKDDRVTWNGCAWRRCTLGVTDQQSGLCAFHSLHRKNLKYTMDNAKGLQRAATPPSPLSIDELKKKVHEGLTTWEGRIRQVTSDLEKQRAALSEEKRQRAHHLQQTAEQLAERERQLKQRGDERQAELDDREQRLARRADRVKKTEEEAARNMRKLAELTNLFSALGDIADESEVESREDGRVTVSA